MVNECSRGRLVGERLVQHNRKIGVISTFEGILRLLYGSSLLVPKLRNVDRRHTTCDIPALSSQLEETALDACPPPSHIHPQIEILYVLVFNTIAAFWAGYGPSIVWPFTKVAT